MKNSRNCRAGAVLLLMLIALIILIASGVGLLTVAYGVRLEAIRTKTEAVAMLAAEAGYEKAIFRMCQQPDLLTGLATGDFISSENITLIKPSETGYEESDGMMTGSYSYTISLNAFFGSRPVYRIQSTGYCGRFSRSIDVYVIQAISGWDMGMCRVPSAPTTTTPVNYMTGEIIDIPLHINSYAAPDDAERDIHISTGGSPRFLRTVSLGEARYSSAGTDKYGSFMHLFEGGIFFQQPSSRITDRSSLQSKVDLFKATLQAQRPDLIFTPASNSGVTDPQAAVQLEFYVESGVGKVRITNNCTVRGYRRNISNSDTWDYCIDTDYETLRFKKYYIYGFHYIPVDAEATGQRITRDVTSTYVTPSYGGIEGEPGGQIFVDGNVVIGGKLLNHSGDQVLKGRLTIVATGNIWIADSIKVDGSRDADGKPSSDNSNVLGLIAQGVIKVVNPGQVTDLHSSGPPAVADAVYEPIGIRKGAVDDHDRFLPNPTVVEAAITVGGGGWGAENVQRTSGWTTYGGRKEYVPGTQDRLVVRGTLTEALRGVVGSGSDGYIKEYYLDERLLQGILPGNIWMKGKYIPAPAGWHDYRSK
ncbi:MAG: hypothetical protein WDA68_02670 [Phycisphaerae bacterium]